MAGRDQRAGAGRAWRRYLLVPQLVLYALRAPRRQAQAWENYWTSVRSTGAGGDVLWDADQHAETEFVTAQLRAHADVGLPMVDVGCGNGRQARALTAVASRVVAVDASVAAVHRARAEPAGPGEPEFRVADATQPGFGERLAAELGESNVHLRGVLHVLSPAQRPAVVRNLAALTGRRGTVFLCETDVAGDQLEYLLRQGATPIRLPDVVRRCVAAGIRAPSHFGPAELAGCFPERHWRVLAAGPTVVFGVPLRPGGPVQQIPAYFAVLRAAR
jgi:SAM-dependent methyltransferase